MTTADLDNLLKALQNRFNNVDKDFTRVAELIRELQQLTLKQNSQIEDLQSTVAEMILLGKCTDDKE